MDKDDEMLVQLFMEEENTAAVRWQQQLIVTSLLAGRASMRRFKARQEEERQAGAMLLECVYFVGDATHTPKEFRRRFRMNKDLVMKIVFGASEYDDYFMSKQDCTGFWGFSI
jgi:hypothetical protein